eukprot:1885181-Amphidinium_carterae.1
MRCIPAGGVFLSGADKVDQSKRHVSALKIEEACVATSRLAGVVPCVPWVYGINITCTNTDRTDGILLERSHDPESMVLMHVPDP